MTHALPPLLLADFTAKTGVLFTYGLTHASHRSASLQITRRQVCGTSMSSDPTRRSRHIYYDRISDHGHRDLRRMAACVSSAARSKPRKDDLWCPSDWR